MPVRSAMAPCPSFLANVLLPSLHLPTSLRLYSSTSLPFEVLLIAPPEDGHLKCYSIMSHLTETAVQTFVLSSQVMHILL